MMNTARHSPTLVAQILAAMRFAATKHRGKQRKDKRTPYVNHLIDVTEVLARVGQVTDLSLLQAAILHDTLEDTETSPEELEEHFGREVRSLVEEVTDDKSLPQAERKRLQVQHAPQLSSGAKQIKIADKLSNLSEITATVPPDWPLQRKREYLDWAEQVVAGCRGCNPALEQAFDNALSRKRQELGSLTR
jgi:(p)ppGpp synthase/HD superfamily hydrolase